MKAKRLLITGGCGFLGSNLAQEALRKHWDLTIVDNFFRSGSPKNYDWLKEQGKFAFHETDIRDARAIERIVEGFKPDVVFHLAGQVAMTTSIENPRLDFETNVLGTINVLESIRKHAPQAAMTFSSTNKVYGDLEQLEVTERETRYELKALPKGVDEDVQLCFSGPYGCSKGAADQYMLDFKRVYGLNTVVFRHSSIFGSRQFGTFDQGWISWFMQQALQTKAGTLTEPFTIAGTGKQVRDVLFVDDLISLYFKAVDQIDTVKGQAFNIGGGPENSLSLLELFAFLEKELGIKLNYKKTPWRQSDQKVFIADVTKAQKLLGWRPTITREQGLKKMLDWVMQNGGA